MRGFLKGAYGAWLGAVCGMSFMGGVCAFVDELSELAMSGENMLLMFYFVLVAICGIVGGWLCSRL